MAFTPVSQETAGQKYCCLALGLELESQLSPGKPNSSPEFLCLLFPHNSLKPTARLAGCKQTNKQTE